MPPNNSPGQASGWARVLLIAAFGALLTIALASRVIGLDRLPGINGDEAYYGILMLEVKAGRWRSW
jgi:hypothetical protein